MVSLPYELDNTLHLPPSLRKELKKVCGELLDEKQIKNRIQGRYTITVGDVVTHTLLTLNLPINVAIVDHRTERHPVRFQDVESFGDKVIKVKNPPGTITPGLWNAIRNAIDNDESTRIDVDGEEDLAVLPAIIFAPVGAMVIYGMPNTGLVALEISDEHKNNAAKMIEMMEV